MSLDILTEKDKRLLSKKPRQWLCLLQGLTDGRKHTSKKGTAIVDGLLFKDGVLSGVVETKCRTCDTETFKNQFRNEWLITYQKVEDAKRCASLLHVPLWIPLPNAKQDFVNGKDH